ncbi:FAD-binding oxidoreductase [Dasania sp. GY-MA-18]|uniref:FAD-binding oxidoreductase n=1 Tax=Dasania phycosphaerae TaxID=2950436 RepID=A0A9J6RLB3_9GAMM|nr:MULTISPECIES: FAD-binding oxidoreductase [Dasania]MCR8923078.1 FAD-binding oxidoreductase [Dasania sp. GY-MA-18]MCZ0865510.1 FAD-binding oxidoreductase [Dasania phycosphaerae]MCZ0869235.1 FAD-binding oxidoreductase [Dasania phycosphaerae]
MNIFEQAQGQHINSYYAASANGATDFPALSEHIEAEVCVVGGGYAGMSAAIELAEQGHSVVLLEAVKMGWAASGRNGGQIIGGWNAGYDDLANSFGRDTATLFAEMSEEGKQIIYQRAEKYGIEADIKKGYVTAAMYKPHLADVQHYAEELEQWGYPHKVTVLSQQDMQQHVASDRYIGGLFDEGSGHFHPLNYALGEAKAAASLGVRIFEHSPVIKVDAGDEPKLYTEQGSVKAKQVILAGNCYLGKTAPKLQKKIMPASTFIIATEPLGAERAKQLLPTDAAVCDLRHILDYFRLSADGRLLFGGKTIYRGVDPKNIAKVMRKDMLKVFPQLADVKIDYAWGGHIDLSVNRMPYVGEYEANVYFAQGFSGHGVVPAHIAGRVLAEKVMGRTERYDAWQQIKHYSFPGGTLLRKPGFLLGSSFFYLQDIWASLR